MNPYLVALRRILPVLVLQLLCTSPVLAQNPAPIQAEEARLELTRQVPISTEVTGRLKNVNPSKLGAQVRYTCTNVEIHRPSRTVFSNSIVLRI